MTDKGTEPRTRIEQWSDSALLATAARIAVLVGTPSIIALMGWLLLTTAANTAQIDTLTATVSGNLALQNNLASYMRHELDDFERVTKAAFDDHETRIRTLEHEQDTKRQH